ncbi:GGDEF domain-containing protein [Modicisalibacter tunisiensis]|uniref:GGDEF domain-containing protein n=1 Tax=Modicisalibacter tunisiensis TaxID=390637 RepID=UPI001CC93889|nr:GGDEF domain-containing protein [Modicisalibacter tunisiensis]MBZ9539851.1 GGDEF domain-containing protein [Modicisalibacter tunisiensis]
MRSEALGMDADAMTAWLTAPCGLLITSPEGQVMAANQRLHDWLGAPRLAGDALEAWLTPSARTLIHWHVVPQLEQACQAEEVHLALKTARGSEIPVLCGIERREVDGRAQWHWALMPIRRKSRLERELIQARRTTERALQDKVTAVAELEALKAELEAHRRELLEKNRHLEHWAYSDALTRLKNRRAFNETLTAWLKEAEDAEGEPLTLALMDIDHFKAINDRHGHPAGDEILQQLAGLMRATFRDHDAIFRVGGEEFAVLLHEADARQAGSAMERLRRAVAAHTWSIDADVTLSVGLADRQVRDSFDSLFVRADHALYRAKRYGRNRIECHDSDAGRP